MEFSEFFHFLTILYESIKLLPKNRKLMASIAILSHIPPSILFLLFISSVQSSTNYIRTSQFLLIYVLEIAFFLLFITINHLSTVATILVSATSYSGKNISFEHIFSSIKGTWRRPLLTSFQVSRSSSNVYLFVPWAFLVAIGSPNPITISIAIFVGITFIVLQLYSSVVWALSQVVSIVEEGFQGREAVEKAAQVVEGQRLHGFMLNLFFSLLLSATFVVCWMVLGDKGSFFKNLTIYGLIVLNLTSFVKMLLFMAYTVLYFQCKQQHGEEIEMIGYLHYTKLPTSCQQAGE
ncbi:uncharacterized protein LOC105155880 [Sesamum indicum]|uniref:Uncharacterized protein LOC105155880 n=1 Tax=Sesamum indicum TaxID=4182 RepID=A0A6I9SKG4_SESIN|nr:uncharacterized protein LOC105155880 [Sesamum indicum]